MRLLDPPDDVSPEEEEADYQAWRARLVAHREEADRKWREREGLIRLSDRPQAEARDGLRRSLPSFPAAQRLFARVHEALGDRAELDPWAAPGERCLLLRDPQRPGWSLPQRFLYLRALPSRPDPGPAIEWQLHLPPRLRRFSERYTAELDAELPPREREPTVLAPGGQPGTLHLYEGAAYYQATYGEGGVFKECCLTSGDLHAFAHPREQPYTLDPFARPPQVPPISLLLRPELRSQGVDLDLLVDLVLAMRPLQAHPGRVFVPCPQPGTVQGTWQRGLRNLREAEWAGDLPDGPGWVVVDGWNGAAVAVAPTFEAAVEAWRAQVARVQPLPPVEGAPAEAAAPAPAPEPEVPPEQGPPEEDAGEEPTRLPPPLPPDVAVASTGPIEIRVEPPVQMEWPAPRPEHVAAAALPLPATPTIPTALREVGFHRVLRLFGDHGEVGFTFLRADEGGFTAIGDEAAPAVDLEGLEAAMDAILAREAEEFPEAALGRNPYRSPEYPVARYRFRAWDDLGRKPELSSGGIGWGHEIDAHEWQIADRYRVVRVRRVRVRPAGGG